MKGISILILISIALVNSVNAAIVYGNIYDSSLDLAKDAIIEVNTEPTQYHIAKDGTYSFNIPQGSYVLKASYKNNLYTAAQNISIKTEGDYVIDLILFPNFDAEEEIINATELEIEQYPKEVNYYLYVTPVLILILTILIYLTFRKYKAKKEIKELPEDLERVLAIIRKSDSRINQKDLRKELDLSEAKISLMLAELEEKGVIKRFKKGRGNIIVLNK